MSVDPRHHRRNSENLQTEIVELNAHAGRDVLGREIRITEPAHVRRLADEPARVQEDSPGEEDPVGERVQARKGRLLDISRFGVLLFRLPRKSSEAALRFRQWGDESLSPQQVLDKYYRVLTGLLVVFV